MAFVSEALIAHRDAGKDIGVANIFPQNKWRSIFYARIWVQTHLRLVMITSYLSGFWKLDKFSFRLLAKCGVGQGEGFGSITTREHNLVCKLKLH